ncbi:MAG: heme exporter protein CcmD [Burkholderiales bacterium]|nr:heme exporter protein CcmD [Burkholderiales bacterium]
MQFLDMGNYGFYVWTAYGVTALAIAIEVIGVRLRWRALARAAGEEEDAP